MAAEPGSVTSNPVVALANVSLALGAFALESVDFALGPGEIGVILGPNGAGKSVTLETIAGFYRPHSGCIRIRGRDVTHLPPEARRVGFILQNFGLFPHLDVTRNIAFGLRARRTRRPPSAPKVNDLLQRFGLQALAQRMPADLSPGEKQRVALARSLLIDPDVFLFDEPFSALDSQTRDRLRDELKQLLRDTGIPAIFVTHDLQDALVLADHLAVMRAGRIIQHGTPDEVFARPASRFVAEFLGVENILEGYLTNRDGVDCRIRVAGHTLRAKATETVANIGSKVCACIRAEDVSLMEPGATHSARPNELQGTVVGLRRLGPLVRITVNCGFLFTAYALRHEVRRLGVAPGVEITSRIDPSAVHVIPDERADSD